MSNQRTRVLSSATEDFLSLLSILPDNVRQQFLKTLLADHPDEEKIEDQSNVFRGKRIRRKSKD